MKTPNTCDFCGTVNPKGYNGGVVGFTKWYACSPICATHGFRIDDLTVLKLQLEQRSRQSLRPMFVSTESI